VPLRELAGCSNTSQTPSLIPVTGLDGLDAYQQSERTRIPVRNLDAFTAYQRSEWFGR
jgi:hypothetical protein